jgi:hypothetical protein
MAIAAVNNAKQRLREWLLNSVPDVETCRDAAAKLRAKHPRVSPERLAELTVAGARKWAIAAGATTGIVSNPLLMIPAALADVAAMLRIECLMAGTVAAILDPSSLDEPEAFEADILTVVFPAAASQALRQVAIRASEQTTKALVRKYLNEDLIKTSLRFAVEFLGIEATQKAVLSKSVPIVGAGIGAAWNWLEIRAVGKRAIRYHTGKPLKIQKNPHRLLPEKPDSTARGA